MRQFAQEERGKGSFKNATSNSKEPTYIKIEKRLLAVRTIKKNFFYFQLNCIVGAS